MIRGSAKDIIIEREPTEDKMGIGYLVPKDTFSIFDYKIYGEWPFTIPYKGLSMAYIINTSYMLAVKNNIKTCFIEDLKYKSKIHVVRVPGKDIPLEQEKVKIGTKNRMVDLEIIFNTYLHPRSSLFKAFINGEKDYIEYGFNETPKPFSKIPRSILSYTTKYDKRGDIKLSEYEAKVRSRLSEDEWIESIRLVNRCVDVINEYARSKNLIRVDGKYEIFVDDNGEVGIADAFGNPEDDRYIVELKDFSLIEELFYTYSRKLDIKQDKIDKIIKELSNKQIFYQDFSKQFLRNLYIDNGWKARFDMDKNVKPPILPKYIINAYSSAMLTFASIWSGRSDELKDMIGKDVGRDLIRPLEEVAAELFVLEYLNRYGLIS